MIETELKAVVDDWDLRRTAVTRAGGVLTLDGTLRDRRYDTREGDLARRDQVLRVRIFHDGSGAAHGSLEWKGPAKVRDGYKLREEIGTSVHDADTLVALVEKLGYVVVRAIDREIAQYDLHDATVRFERYPRMDDLIEVEGEPAAIERAIAAIGIPRTAYTAEALPAFVRRFEARTGERAAISARDLGGAGGA
jgi:predicted adenylyl cyclase CyaB